MARVALYGLYDPRTGALRYIGKASDPANRLKRHCRPGVAAMHLPVARWSVELTKIGLSPRMEVLTWAHDWETAERRLIAAHRKAGADLLNVARGGVHIPSGKVRGSRGLWSAEWRSVVSQCAYVIHLVGDHAKQVWRDILTETGKTRRLALRRYGPEALRAYDKALHAQFVLRRPLACRPWPWFDCDLDLAT